MSAQRVPMCYLHDQPAGSCTMCFDNFYESQGRFDLRNGLGYQTGLSKWSDRPYRRGWEAEARERALLAGQSGAKE